MISIIYIYRDREIDRVKNSLDSLRAQTNKHFNVLFVDYGSSDQYHHDIKALVKEYEFCRYIFNNTRGWAWNRAHALNTGIKLAETEFIFTADVDMIFTVDFIEILYQVSLTSLATFFAIKYLPEKGFQSLENLKNYNTSDEFALGLALIQKKLLLEVNGYDEFFSFWGFEDNDIKQRIESTGINTKYFNEKILMYHQWHPSHNNSNEYIPLNWGIFLRDYLNDKTRFDSKNYNWGEVYTIENRPALKVDLNNNKVTQISGRAEYVCYKIFNALLSSNKLVFSYQFTDTSTKIFKESGAYRITKLINKILEYFKIPLTVKAKYQDNYSTVYNVRDRFIYNLVSFRSIIKDYYYDIKDNTFNVVLVKRSGEF